MKRSALHTFPKNEHLKSRKTIESLFSKNLSLKAYPLRAVYDYIESDVSLKAGFSVPKRKFQKAVDRNLIKRRMREAFRLHNSDLKMALKAKNESLAIMILYTASAIPEYAEIESKMKLILNQLSDAIDQ